MKILVSVLMMVVIQLGLASQSHAAAVMDAPSCAQWDPRQEVYRVWIEAYLSGIAMEKNDNFLEKAKLDYIVDWVSNYCKEHPKGEVAVAGVQLSMELMKRKRPASR